MADKKPVTWETLTEDVPLVVTGMYVTAKTMTAEGWRVLGFAEGAPLPKDVPLEDKKHLYRKGLVREEGWTPADEPDTTADDAIAYAESVKAGALTGLERAQRLVDQADARLSDAQAQKVRASKSASPPPPPSAAGQDPDPEPPKAAPRSKTTGG
jgi:hypothetical protein